MDITELIKSYSDNQKKVFTAFVIQLPIIYSIGFLSVRSFAQIDMIDKICIICACNIALCGIGYLFSGILSSIKEDYVDDFIIPITITPSVFIFAFTLILSLFTEQTITQVLKGFAFFYLGEILTTSYLAFRKKFQDTHKSNRSEETDDAVNHN